MEQDGIEEPWGHGDGYEYIGRGSPWGNPFPVEKSDPDSRERSVHNYKLYMRQHPGLRLAARELAGKQLVCFCKPAICHGDYLAELANEVDWELVLREARARRASAS